MAVDRWMIIIVVLFIALMVAYPLIPKPGYQPVGKEDAIKIALEDAGKAYPEASLKVVSVEAQETGWNVEVKISFNSDTCCPRLLVRDYELLPVKFKETELVKNCMVSGTIIFDEEALVTAGKAPRVAPYCSEARGKATFLDYAQIKRMKECTDCSELEKFISDLPDQDAWVVQWSIGGETVFTALDAEGNILK
jgi:hypothetical protein